MTMQEFIKDECKAAWQEGKQEGIQEGIQKGIQEGKQEANQKAILNILSIKGMVSEALKEKIKSIQDTDMSSAFIVKAAQAQSIQEFEQELEKCLMQQE